MKQNQEIEDLFYEPTFEDLRKENGMVHWFARDLMILLGYSNYNKFSKVLDRAIKAMMSLNIRHEENIVYCEREIEGKILKDAKLTRFACYLVAMNGDPKKEEVAKVQLYFINQTRQFELLIQHQNQVERVATREELKEATLSLNSTAQQHGLTKPDEYAKFTNAGYLGMYNMMNWELAKKRGIDSKELLDYMGNVELAANTLRAALTRDKIENENIYGLSNLETAQRNVGNIVRKTIKEATGKYPEDLPKEPKLPSVKKELKGVGKEMQKLDKSSKTKEKKN